MKTRPSVLQSLSERAPWAVLGCLLAGAAILVGAEILSLQSLRKARESGEAAQQLREKSYEARELRVQKLEAQRQTLENAAESILSGLLKKNQEDADPAFLNDFTMRVERVRDEESTAHFSLSSNDMEYHSFLPTINRLEHAVPFMRCSRLSLKSDGITFHTSAQPLQVDVELVFPKASSGASVPVPGPSTTGVQPVQ